MTENLEAKKCYEFGDDGFRCVPHGACKNGEIITTGAGLIDTRSLFFNPERSVCDKFTDVCCRLPAWKGKAIFSSKQNSIALAKADMINTLSMFYKQRL